MTYYNRIHALYNIRGNNPLENKDILMVIAHPDDEVMFFGPTLVGVLKPEHKNKVAVLCMSNGAYFEDHN